MSLLFVDSFDHYTTPADKYDQVQSSGGSGQTIITTGGRWGTSRLSTARFSGGGQHYVRKDIPANPTTIIVGFAFQILTHRIDATLFSIMDSNDSSVHISLTLDAQRRLQVLRGAFGGTLLGVSDTPIPNSVFHYIELKILIDDSAGTVDLRQNGTSVLSLTGQDTRNGGNGDAGNVRFGCGETNAAYSWTYDDIYVCDDSGSINNDFLGDIRVQLHLPDADGFHQDWLGVDSVPNFGQVNENPPDDDTSYVATEGGSVGDIDTYEYPVLDQDPATVHGAQTVVHSRRDDSVDREIRGYARSNGTDEGGSFQVVPDGYTDMRMDIFETDPDTGSAWTEGGMNAAEFGMEGVS